MISFAIEEGGKRGHFAFHPVFLKRKSVYTLMESCLYDREESHGRF